MMDRVLGMIWKTQERIKMFNTIWEMQLDLNKVVGRDTVNDSDKTSWLYDYAQALEDEIVELKNCINWKWWAKEAKENGQYMVLMDEKNAKIEAIDALHFYMSLLHIADQNDYDFIDVDEIKADLGTNYQLVPTIFATCEELLNIVRDMKNATDWNIAEFIESRKSIENMDEVYQTLSEGWYHLNVLFFLLGMSYDDILDIYKMKHEKNLKRQENGYAVMTKTEADNNEIKDNI